MPWVKNSDTGGTHPKVMRPPSFVPATAQVLERDVVLNEVFGWLQRCALHSAGHMTDYVIEAEVARLYGGARTDRLLALARRAGLLTLVPRQRGETTRYRLLEDDDLFHIRSRAEIEWERQRKRDNSRPSLTMPVKRRDGDGCRYCGVVVHWRGNKASARSGTFDHRVPGEAGTVETTVVSCLACNSSRGADPAADLRVPLRDVPESPYYSDFTATQLSKYFGVPFTSTEATSTQRPASPPASPQPASPRSTTPREPAASEPPQHHEHDQRDVDHQADTPRPGPRSTTRDPDPAAPPAPPARPEQLDPPHPAPPDDPSKPRDAADVSRRQPTSTASRSTGRVGSGREPHPPHPPPSQPPEHHQPTRRPRGRRGRGTPPPGGTG